MNENFSNVFCLREMSILKESECLKASQKIKATSSKTSRGCFCLKGGE